MEIYDLTKEQEIIKNILQSSSEISGIGLYSAKERCFGKTTIINNLGLEFQALGYNVIVVTPTYYGEEYVANEKLIINDSNCRGKFVSENSVILVDELEIEDLKILIKIAKRSRKEKDIKIIGFVHF